MHVPPPVQLIRKIHAEMKRATKALSNKNEAFEPIYTFAYTPGTVQLIIN